jgi:prolyl oligopeptidase
MKRRTALSDRSFCALFASGLIAFAVASTAFAAQHEALDYPDTKRIDHVDDYHGTKIEDPYRWLEDDARESQDVADWVAAQNEVTFGYLQSLPERERIQSMLTELWDYEKFAPPFKRGGRYYFFKNDGLQNQYVLYTAKSLSEEPRVLLDPNTWSADGTVALGGTSFSDDGRYMAYAKSSAGSDWRIWHVRDLFTDKDLPEEVKWCKFTDASWTPDGKGFFYSRYDEPTESEFTSVNKFQKLYYHRAGTPQSDDVLVYHRPDEPDWGFGPTVTEDGRYLVITIWKGTGDKYRVMYRDLAEPYAMPVDLISEFESEYTFLGNDGPVFYFKTDLNAPRGRAIAIDTKNPQRENWREIIPQSEDTLRSVSLVGNQFVAGYLHDATTAVKLYDVAGNHVRDVELPGIGTAGGFGGKRTDTETFYSFSSFATPPSVYRFDVITGESTLLDRAQVAMNPDDYIVKQVFYNSKDGTRVPMFICHHKETQVDGNTPTLLYGYGGFNIPLTPGFSVTRLAWMKMGGVYAVANLRGGGEYGEEWHQAGTKLNKQNVFDDFIAAAEYLHEEGYTSPDKLAIQGGSNGGLLVGAVMTQRPDLFGVALPAVGVMDMLRFHKFTIGWAWVDDYGSADDPEEFEALRAYSPYHNMKQGVKYPATLVTTADTDDRVVPGHSFKFIAALQHAHKGDVPVLARIETRAGHGAGKPTSKIIEEAADVMAFTFHNLGVNPTLDEVPHEEESKGGR